MCRLVQNFYIDQPAVNGEACAIVATHRELGFQVESTTLAIQQIAADHFAFDRRIQTIYQNAHQFPSRLTHI